MTNKEHLEKNFSNKFLDCFFNLIENKGCIELKKEDLTTEDDIHNYRMLKFRKYIKEKSIEQLYFPFEKTPDGDEVYYFKLREKFFYMITFDEIFFENNNLDNGFDFIIREVKEIPIDFIYLDEEIPLDVLQNRELVEYIIVNEKVKTNLDFLKLMNSIAKSINISSVAQIRAKNRKYNIWFNGGEKNAFWINDKNSQKRIFLEASNEKMKELCGMFYSYDIASCSLGVMNKYEAKRYIKDLKEFEI